MKTRHFIISLIGLILILALYFIFKNENIVLILTLSQTIISYITLMIAIVLFDRYQAGSKLNDKTLNVVMEYVEFLQKKTIILESYIFSNKKIQKDGFKIIDFRSNQDNKNLTDNKVYVNFKSFFFFYRDFIKYVNSPWMPQEIKNASKFLKPANNNRIYNLDKIKTDCKILNFVGYETDYVDLVIFSEIENEQLLYLNINNLMMVIEKWIKNQASDINFHI